MTYNEKHAFFTSEHNKKYKLWSSQKMADALNYILDNIFIKFGSIYRDELYVFQWVLVVLHLRQICFCFVMGEISCCLFLTIIKLMLLKFLTLSHDI